MPTSPDASEAPPHDKVMPRWPVYLRFGHHEEVQVGDVFADTAPELLTAMARLLRTVADDFDERVRTL